MKRLLIATNNAGKVEEFRGVLEGCGWEVVAPGDLGLCLQVEEAGLTYADNARLKAHAFARAAGMPALADDSGLEVDELDGEPGPLHHLHGWDGAAQGERIDILLRALHGVPPERRTARFRSVIVLALPDGAIHETDGVCEGVIATAASGQGGFGYDPVFVLPDGRTMAQLSLAEKNQVSHRGLAAAKMRQVLRDLPAV